MKLEIKNLNIEIESKRVVTDLNLVINSGEVHILMGQNGSGKSSFLNALMKHPKYKVISGGIFLDGIDITKTNTEDRAKLGLFLSMQHLPDISGVSLTNFLHKAYQGLKGEKIGILDFHKKLEGMAKDAGIDTGFLKRYVNAGLSGGEKKQSEMLQLLTLEPNFAFLDEIDSGVDSESLSKVFKIISKLKKQGTGFILVTHYDNVLKHIKPDFVHVMYDGRIVRSGGKELVKEIKDKGYTKLICR